MPRSTKSRVSWAPASATTDPDGGTLEASRHVAMVYSLARFTGLCFVDGHAIFLNARADRYTMLPPAPSRALAAYCDGGDIPGVADIPFDTLVQAGLLRNRHDTAPLAPCSPPTPHARGRDTRPTVGWISVLAAWRDFLVTQHRLERRGLEAMLIHLCNLRGQAVGNPKVAIDRRAAAFDALRFVVSPQGRCLPLSLALASRCCSSEVQLILGVKLHPFAAHAWVQHGHIVLNDEVHVVEQFTPILAI